VKRNSVIVVLLILSVSLGMAVEASKKKSNWLKKISKAVPGSGESADVAGVRGLDESDVNVVGSSARDYAAIDELESIDITDEELQQFATEEGLK